MMKIICGGGAIMLLLAFALAGCDKEKIVTSTEYVHDTKYIELPADTVLRIDTVYNNDVDTVIKIQQVHDTVRVTTVVHDTVLKIQNHYDTVVVTDTVLKTQCLPSAYLAVSAMQYHTNPLVIEFATTEFGMSDGWIYYLASDQMDVSQPSSNVWDIYGYLDFWAPDWSGYYPMEFYWRVTFRGGDPSDPENWQMSEPPAAAGHRPGVSRSAKSTPVQLLQR